MRLQFLKRKYKLSARNDLRIKILSTIVILFFIGVLSSCNRERGSSHELEGLIAKNIALPDSLNAYYASKDSLGQFNWNEYSAKNKIIVYIDGDCFNCVEDLAKWEQIVSNFDAKNLVVVFYIYISPDNFEPIRRFARKSGFSSIILLDLENKFYHYNKISDNKLLQAMLLDHNNATLVFGNPIYSNDLLQLYKRVLN